MKMQGCKGGKAPLIINVITRWAKLYALRSLSLIGRRNYLDTVARQIPILNRDCIPVVHLLPDHITPLLIT
jgi:hypothetical protein